MSNSFHDFARFESVDVDPVVATDAADNVGTDSADLNGELIHLGGAASADAQFEWGEVGNNFPNTTSPQPLSSPQTFDETITGLTGGTDYEFRATATASDGDTDTGGVQTFTTQTATQTVDDFDDCDLNGWADVSTSSSSPETVSSPTDSGACSARMQTQQVGGEGIASTSGLAAYPSAGDTWEFHVRMNTDAGTFSPRGYFAAQSETYNPDGYLINYDIGESNLGLYVRQSGSNSQLGQDSSCNWPAGEWCRVTVEWGSSGSITVTAYDGSDTQIGQVTATDTTYTSGGVSYRVAAATYSDPQYLYVDSIKITG